MINHPFVVNGKEFRKSLARKYLIACTKRQQQHIGFGGHRKLRSNRMHMECLLLSSSSSSFLLLLLLSLGNLPRPLPSPSLPFPPKKVIMIIVSCLVVRRVDNMRSIIGHCIIIRLYVNFVAIRIRYYKFPCPPQRIPF